MDHFYSVVVLLVLHVSQCASEFRENLFNVYEDKKINQYNTLTTIDSIRSKEQCAAYCLERPACMSVSYNNKSHQCKISNVDPQNQPGILADHSKWIVLAKYNPQGNWVTVNNISLLLSTIRLSWMEARSYCESHNSTMIELRNESINSVMYKALDKDKKDSDRFYWTGGKGLGVNFVWSSDNTAIGAITHWLPGQPGSMKHDDECIELVGTSGYSWSNVKCENKNKFVCVRPSQL